MLRPPLFQTIVLPEYSDERPLPQQPLTVEWIGSNALRTTRHSVFSQEETAKCLTVMQHRGFPSVWKDGFLALKPSEHAAASPFSDHRVLPEYSDERPLAQQPLTVEWIGSNALRTTRHSVFLQEETAKCLTVMQHRGFRRVCWERWLPSSQTFRTCCGLPFFRPSCCPSIVMKGRLRSSLSPWSGSGAMLCAPRGTRTSRKKKPSV